ncbi:MAG: hypothetical protein WBV82_07825 [Myxococcaceae bacterium]
MKGPLFTSERWSALQGLIGRVSRPLGHLRFAFMPFGLFALIAVGVHAAADTLDDRILWLVDGVDGALDTVLGAWSFTEPAVRWIDLEDRVRIARAVALIWELLVDALLALPAFGYRESFARPLRGFSAFLGTAPPKVRALFRDVVQRPTVLRVTRPLAAGAIALAGACAVARMLQASMYLSTRSWIGDDAAGIFARLLALAALAGVLITFGLRAVLRNLQHADEIARAHPNEKWFLTAARGLPGSALIVPLAIAALLDASPVLSFFR